MVNRQLMQAVLASADDDDDARLVYADWCEDEGDLARARLIRVQIERRRLSRWDVKQIALQVEEEKLIEDHGGRWIAELEPVDGITWTGFERGFVARAEADSFGALCAARDAIVQQTPLEHIKVPWPEDEARAKSAPVFPTLRGLRIERAVRDREPYWLAQSPLLSTLTELALADGYAEDPGTRAILNSKYLRKLKKLELVRNEVGLRGVRGLIEADLPLLEDLTLQEHGPDDGSSWSDWEGGLDVPEMQQLASWSGLQRLKRMDLSFNRIPAEGLDALFHSPGLISLQDLIIEHTFGRANELNWDALGVQLQEVGLGYHVLDEIVCQAQSLSGVRSLDLNACLFLGIQDVEQLLSRCASTLSVLDFRSIDLDGEEHPVRVLMRSSLPALHTLSVGMHRTELPNVPEFFACPAVQNVQCLRLDGVYKRVDAICGAELHQLQQLHVTNLGGDSRAKLLASPLGKRLHETGGLRFVKL